MRADGFDRVRVPDASGPYHTPAGAEAAVSALSEAPAYVKPGGADTAYEPEYCGPTNRSRSIASRLPAGMPNTARFRRADAAETSISASAPWLKTTRRRCGPDIDGRKAGGGAPVGGVLSSSTRTGGPPTTELPGSAPVL